MTVLSKEVKRLDRQALCRLAVMLLQVNIDSRRFDQSLQRLSLVAACRSPEAFQMFMELEKKAKKLVPIK